MKKFIYKFYKIAIDRFYGILFKPKGFYISKKDFLLSKSEIEFKIIENAKTLNIEGNEIYKFMNSEIFDEASFEMGEVWITKIYNGRILTNLKNAVAIVDEFGKLIEGLSFTYDKNENNQFYHAPVDRNYFLSTNDIAKPKKVRGTVFSLLTGGGKNFNFYHWFLDSLSRLGDLELAGWTEKVDYYLVPEYVKDFQKESLQMLGIPSSKILSSIENKHVIADCMIASSHPRSATFGVRRLTVEFLHRKFQNVDLVYNLGKKFPKKFLISRNDAPRRKVKNENDFSKMLMQFGIETIEISKFTFQEVIYLFRNAELVVSPHGASLTNMIFCYKDVRIIELFDESCVLPYYFELAKSINLNYDYLLCSNNCNLSNVHIKSRYDVQEFDLLIDIDIVFKFLDNSLI